MKFAVLDRAVFVTCTNLNQMLQRRIDLLHLIQILNLQLLGLPKKGAKSELILKRSMLFAVLCQWLLEPRGSIFRGNYKRHFSGIRYTVDRKWYRLGSSGIR